MGIILPVKIYLSFTPSSEFSFITQECFFFFMSNKPFRFRQKIKNKAVLIQKNKCQKMIQ